MARPANKASVRCLGSRYCIDHGIRGLWVGRGDDLEVCNCALKFVQQVQNVVRTIRQLPCYKVTFSFENSYEPPPKALACCEGSYKIPCQRPLPLWPVQQREPAQGEENGTRIQPSTNTHLKDFRRGLFGRPASRERWCFFGRPKVHLERHDLPPKNSQVLCLVRCQDSADGEEHFQI